MGQSAQTPSLPIRTALVELGFFYGLFTLIVSGPSVLSLLQTVFVEHRLVDALQWIVDGYDGISAVVGGALEPLLAPAVAWLERTFRWELTLQPYWRPLFVLLSMFVIGWTRTAWRSGAHVSAAAFFVLGSTGAFLGAAAAGLVPLSVPSRALSGIVAAAPLLITGVFLAAPLAAMDGAVADRKLALGAGLFCLVAMAIAWLGFMAGTAWQMAGFDNGAGVLGLGTVILAMGGFSFVMATGPNQYALNAARLGLVLLGGFFVAALILAADAVLKVLQA